MVLLKLHDESALATVVGTVRSQIPMNISITNTGRRNPLACVRLDGSSEVADLGPSLAHHDLAHLVAESR